MDASFLDTNLVHIQNENLEDAFVHEIRGRFRPGTSENEIRTAVVDTGKAPRLCCQKTVREKLSKALIDHLHYHPMLRHRPDQGPVTVDPVAIWREQCQEMNNLCRQLG